MAIFIIILCHQIAFQDQDLLLPVHCTSIHLERNLIEHALYFARFGVEV